MFKLQKRTHFPGSNDLQRKRPKPSVTDTIREEFNKTGNIPDPDAESGINGVSTTAFLSSAFLITIGFCLKDGFFKKYNAFSLFQGFVFFFLRFLMTLLLLVLGIVIFQTILDSKNPGRNQSIYWCILTVTVVLLIVLL